MNNLKKALTSVGVAAALLGGSVIAAGPAEAYTGSYDYYTYAYCEVWYYKWRDYNWYEETFLWKHDRYEVVAVERIC